MYKLPDTGWKQTNKSDLVGNIEYSKNLNFDTGYLKLSSRCVSLLNDVTDTDFDIPNSFGRYTNGGFSLVTSDNPYLIDLGNTAILITKDTDSDDDAPPNLTFNSFGKWWNNKWHVTTDTALYYKTISNGNWTDTGITALTSGIPHPIESFEKANTLLVANGNTVRQLDSSYSVGTYAQLTLSSDFEVVGLAYNNNQVAIATRLASTIEGQNKEAELFIWDGSESSANGGYKIGTDACVNVFPYKSSFVVINRLGEVLYFNGGGFERIGQFPVQDVIWGDFLNRLGYGDNITVDGDLIYFNIRSTISSDNGNTYKENMLGGIWCYDPNIGLYHKYSPSISTANLLSTNQANTNVSTNTITKTSGTILETGNPVKVTQSYISPIYENHIYYIIKVSSTEFKLASTKENALALIPIDLTSVSAGNSYFMALDLKDYGQSRNSRYGGVSLMGSKSRVYDKIIFGGECYSSTSFSTTPAHLNISVSGFKNIGYVVTGKMSSDNVEDNIVKAFIKYKTLDIDDSIVVKYKNKDVVGFPEYANCTASSTTVFTTTSYIPKSYAYTGEIECEVISGAGAGQMVKVSSITESGGTYTITLNSQLEGVSASDTLTVKLDNWIELKTITSADNLGWKEIALAKTSKWAKFKIVLIGSNVTLEELQIINNNHIPSK